MAVYYFTAAVTCSQVRPTRGPYGPVDSMQVWDGCPCQIVLGSSPEDAQSQFETWLRAQPEGENPRDVVIRKITSTRIVDKFLTESGDLPLDWPKILKQQQAILESMPVDDFEQGNWVDVDEVVRPDKLSFSAGTLQSDVPEDIRSGLNWASDRQFIFFLSILLPPPPPPNPNEQFEEDRPDLTEPETEPETQDFEELGKPRELSPEELYAAFPDACNKEAVAVIQARNSVVAAWLWRRYAANTPLAANAIRLEPWPGTLGEPDNS